MNDYKVLFQYHVPEVSTIHIIAKSKKQAAKHLKETFSVPVQVLKVQKTKKVVDVDDPDVVNAADLD